jgi:hypothetical protein
VDAAAYASEAGDTATPAGASEAVRWAEDTGPVVLPQFNDTELAWELARVTIPARGLGVLEQVATYLRVEAPGVSFRTQPNTDPFTSQPFVDNDGNTLAVRWRLVAPSLDNRPRAAGIPGYAVPAGPDVSMPVEWSDFRFAWGSRYTGDLRALVPGGSRQIRLFALVRITGPGQWAVTVGGRLAGFTQQGGTRKAALTAALARGD